MAYPNPSDPLNIEAANMYNRNKLEFDDFVKQNVQKYAWAEEKKEIQEEKVRIHKVSTDIEDLQLSCDLSNASQLSELSETSGIFFEEELF